ncbi:MAG: YciI family protein [bacterium]
MRYMCLIKHEESQRSLSFPPGFMDAMNTFVGEALKNGTITDTAGLKGTADASRIAVGKGKLTVTDGPFAESKEVVGGYAIVEAATREEAMAFVTKFMDMHRIYFPEFEGECELRPLEEM